VVSEFRLILAGYRRTPIRKTNAAPLTTGAAPFMKGLLARNKLMFYLLRSYYHKIVIFVKENIKDCDENV